MRAHYDRELESVRQNVVQMGETTLCLMAEALSALADPSRGLSPIASALEAQTDHQHRAIRDQCLKLIILQAPVARDARLVIGVLDAIVDLELIGDYSHEIALRSMMRGRPPSQVVCQILAVGGRIWDGLTAAIASWRSLDREQALSVRPQESPIRAECGNLYEKLSGLASVPGGATNYVELMLICRHLESGYRAAECALT